VAQRHFHKTGSGYGKNVFCCRHAAGPMLYPAPWWVWGWYSAVDGPLIQNGSLRFSLPGPASEITKDRGMKTMRTRYLSASCGCSSCFSAYRIIGKSPSPSCARRLAYLEAYTSSTKGSGNPQRALPKLAGRVLQPIESRTSFQEPDGACDNQVCACTDAPASFIIRACRRVCSREITYSRSGPQIPSHARA